MGVLSNRSKAELLSSREAERRSRKTMISSLLSLSLALTGFFPLPASAAVGTAPCEQNTDNDAAVTVVQSGTFCYIAFKYINEADGIQDNAWYNPSGVTQVDALVVGGGGGGGSRHGGGGGAGAVLEFMNHPIPVAGLNASVGRGGAGAVGAPTSYIGSKGFYSQFAGIRAIGGGAGVNGTSSNVDGGSGGGAGWNQTVGQPQSQAVSTLTGTNLGNFTGGFAGASGARDLDDFRDVWAGGGGGGAGAAGARPTANGITTTEFSVGQHTNAVGGAGGVGKAISWITPAIATALGVGHISGGQVYFGGGGGGGMGADGLSGGPGGLGGGANGTEIEVAGNNGSANTGGGGGGSGFDDIAPGTSAGPEGGDGGSGVIVLRYSIVPSAPTSLSNSDITTTSVRISFTAPSYVPGGPAYTVGSINGYQYSLNGGTTWISASQTVSPIVITGLSPETTYGNVRIRAVNNNGGGDVANVASFTTPRDPNAYLRLHYNSTDVTSYDAASTSPLAVTNLGSMTVSGTIVNQSNGAISLDSATRAWNFPGGTNANGSFIDVGDFSYSGFRSGGITVDFEADFGSANFWERLFDFGEMRTSTVGERNNFFISRFDTTNELAVGLWGNGAVISECRTTDGSLTSGMARWTVRLDGSRCTIWKNDTQRTVGLMNGGSAGSSVSFGVMPDVTVTNNFIGKSNWTADAQFEGRIRSIRFYQGAFTPSELGAVPYNLVQFNRAGGNADPASLTTSGRIRVPSVGSVTRAGYTLTGWGTGASTISPGSVYLAPSGTSTLVASWSPNSNTVSWDVNGGSSIADTSFFTAGTVQRPADPTKSGVVFGGWSTTETSNNGDLANRIETWPYSPSATSGITLYAIWVNACTATTTTFVGTGTTDLTSATYGETGRTYTQLRFNTTGTCGWVVPAGVSAADVMIVGGGGAGSYYGLAGGGGAGAVLVSSQSLALTPGQATLVQAGTGGTFTLVSEFVTGNTGTKGQQSRFGSFIAPGGGSGAGGTPTPASATSGGSGGGGAACTARSGAAAGANPNYAGFNYFANAGASAAGSTNCQGAPGGGGGAGGAATNQDGGASLTRFGIEVAGGGAAFLGGAVGGGNVGGDWVVTCDSSNQATRAGATNTGSGGSSCGSGGSGTVVLRFSADYTITLAPGASGSGTVQTFTKSQAATLILPNTASANASFTRAGFNVVGWSTTDGGARTHNLGGSFTTDANTTLYPVWAANDFRITFRAGTGASGSDQVIVKQPSVSATLLAASLANHYFTRANFRVTGWSTTDGGGQVFDLGASYLTDSDVVLFPVWSSLCAPSQVGRYIDGQPYWVLDFTNTGSCAWQLPSGLSSIEAMVLAAGGGGGGAYDAGGAGGGGGGQVRLTGPIDVSGHSQMTIRVGAGGAGGTASRVATPAENHGARGENSELFLTIVNKFLSLGGDGGSRSRGDYQAVARAAGTGGAAATNSAGAEGGAFGSGGGTGGGGGGAGGPGGTSTGILRGVAGLGFTSSISGISQIYGAGGAGGVGNSFSTSNGAANSGNGGRGAGSLSANQANGSNGGSGRVIVRYLANISTNSSLAALTVSPGVLSPSFVSATRSYTLAVPSNSAFITVSPEVAEFGARIRVNGNLLAPTSTSVTVSTPVGVSVLTVHVTAPNGVASTSYTVTISRLGPTLHTEAGFLGTSVTWSSNTYFNSFASQSGVLDTDAVPTNNMIWQLFYAHTELRIPADGVNRLGVNSYQSGSRSWNWYFAASSTPNTLGSFSSPVVVGQQPTTNFSAGGFSETTATTSVTVPANTYFLVGIENGPTHRSIKQSPNRTASVSGSNIVTSMNTVFLAPSVNGSNRGVPTALGGSLAAYNYSSTPVAEYVQYDGYQSVISIKFRYLNDFSTDASLTAISLSAGVLTPGFQSSSTTYSVTVSPSVASMTVSATVNNQFATLTVNGNSVNSGSSSNAINLSYGANTVSITVTAQDGSTRSYVLSVTRPLPVYLVTYDRNGSQGAPERSSESFTLSSSAITLPLVGTMAKTGYTFGGWSSIQNDATTKITGAYTPSQSITLYAIWTAGQYSYSYNVNGATTGSPSATSGTYTTGGTAITLATQNTLARTGYTFNGWATTQNDATTKVLNSGSLTISAPVIFYALWDAINYSVSYTVTGSDTGTAPTDSSNYNISQSATVKANSGNLVKAGYTFAGWTINSDGSGTVYQPGNSYVFGAGNVTFYPKFTPNTYVITYNPNGATGTPAGGITTSYTTGDAGISLANVGTMAKTGYDFTGWSANPTGTAHSGAYTTNANVTLYAIWTLKDISVTYARGALGGTALSSNEIATFPQNTSGKYNASITLSPTVSSTIVFGGNNYQFFGWNDGNSTFQALDRFTLTETAPTFTAQWVRLYAVRYALNGGTGIVTIDTECQGVDNTCLANDVITLSNAPTRDGYTFIGWKDQSNNSYSAGTAFTVTSTQYLLYAQWQAIDYTMSFDSAGGANSPASLSRTIGQSFAMPNPGARTGYDFAGWSDGSLTYGLGVTYNVGVGNQNFVAQWTPRTYLVDYNWNGGTRISGAAIATTSYTVGNAGISLPTGTTYARDGYVFDGWSLTDGGTKLASPYSPSSTLMLYARWLDGSFELNYNAKGGSSPRARDFVSRSASLILPTPSRAGFTFTGWYEDSALTTRAVALGNAYSPSASKTLYAKWIQNSLAGINPAHLNTLATITITGAHSWSGNHALSGTGASISLPNGALDNGTVLSVSFVDDLTRPSNLIDSSFAYYTSVVVHWLKGTGDSATVPDTAVGKPVTLTLINPNIKIGAKVFMIVNGVAIEVATATVDGQVVVEMTQDPEFVVAATRPDAPRNVVATAGNTSASISWTVPGSGGSDITSYTVTATNGGGSCTTVTLSCVVSGLVNGSTYSFTVTATNAIGTSAPSSVSGVVTPALATFTVTFNSNGGSLVSSATFPQAGSITQPTSPTKQGFTFAGWSTTLNDATTAVSFPFSPSSYQNLTLYALWTAIPVVVPPPGPIVIVPPVLPPGPVVSPKPKVSEPTSEILWKANTVRQLALTGTRLNMVKAVTVGGKPVQILRKLPNKLVLKLPTLKPGLYALEIDYGAGKVKTGSFVRMLDEPVNKVTVGSFNGKAVLYVRGFEGQRVSARIGDRWVVIPASTGEFQRIVVPVGIGYELNIPLYVGRKQVDIIYLLTH